jgi:hypothetical protein
MRCLVVVVGSVADGGRDGEKSKGEIGMGVLLLLLLLPRAAVGEETTGGCGSGGGDVGRGRD